MKNIKSVVKLSELPARTKSLSVEEITDLFAGCSTGHGYCHDLSGNPSACVCCPNYYCFIASEDVYYKDGRPAGQKTVSNCEPI